MVSQNFVIHSLDSFPAFAVLCSYLLFPFSLSMSSRPVLPAVSRLLVKSHFQLFAVLYHQSAVLYTISHFLYTHVYSTSMNQCITVHYYNNQFGCQYFPGNPIRLTPSDCTYLIAGPGLRMQ